MPEVAASACAENCDSSLPLVRPVPTSLVPLAWKWRRRMDPAMGPSGATDENP